MVSARLAGGAERAEAGVGEWFAGPGLSDGAVGQSAEASFSRTS
jgi:hypothetical protein